MSHRLVSRVAFAALVAATAVGVTPGHGHAATGEFAVSIDAAPNGGATAVLVDTLVPSNRYVLTLTSAGTGTCGLTGPTVQIADYDIQGAANPVTAAVSGACTLYNASVIYVATWTGVPGSSGQLPMQCTWVRGMQTCSPGEFRIVAP